MRLGRVLARYQEPALVFGTSALVKSGQHDYGAISAAVNIVDNLPGDKQYEPVVLDSVVREYKTLFYNHVLGDYGIPKASATLVDLLDPKQFPPEIRDMIGPSRELWRTKSMKAASGGVLGRADLHLLTFVHEQAENGRECYVFTYDEDESGPVKHLESRFPHIHLAEESLQSADRLAEELNIDATTDDKHILLYPKVLGELYGMEASTEATHYLLTIKVPFAGNYEELGISINPMESGITFEDGGISRYPLLVLDLDKLIESIHTPKYWVTHNQIMSKFERALKALSRRYLSRSTITIVKSRKYANIKMTKSKTSTKFSRGELTSETNSDGLEWLTIDNNYLRKFSPETVEYLRNFRSSVPK